MRTHNYQCPTRIANNSMKTTNVFQLYVHVVQAKTTMTRMRAAVSMNATKKTQTREEKCWTKPTSMHATMRICCGTPTAHNRNATQTNKIQRKTFKTSTRHEINQAALTQIDCMLRKTNKNNWHAPLRSQEPHL